MAATPRRRKPTTGQSTTAPVFTVGIGDTSPPRDREVVNLTAGEPLLPGASIDLSVSATSTGFGTRAVELRLSANGRPVEYAAGHAVGRRRARPRGVHRSPAPDRADGLHRGVPVGAGRARGREQHAAACWCRRRPARRRILIVEGAPGYEHTFLKRALAQDPGPRRRCGGAQGAERRRARHFFRAGRPIAGWPRCRRDIREAIGAVRVRRASSSATSRPISSRAISWR